ncbi:MAG TPA: hypothetical protein VHC22_24475 [Pirellulales bacterium]|nr:hypothetical protein [Pirellulales bacterium]
MTRTEIDAERQVGHVKKINHIRGFGIIDPNVFFHRLAVHGIEWCRLSQWQEVRFDRPVKTAKGWMTEYVEPLQAESVAPPAPPRPITGETVTAIELAKLSGCSWNTVTTLARDGMIPSAGRNEHGHIIFDLGDDRLMAWLKAVTGGRCLS